MGGGLRLKLHMEVRLEGNMIPNSDFSKSKFLTQGGLKEKVLCRFGFFIFAPSHFIFGLSLPNPIN